MNKKALRKELSSSLLKEMEEILNKHNSEVSRIIRKTTREASKTVAKKFVKALKDFPGIRDLKKTERMATAAPVSASKKATTGPPAKKKIVPLKSKVKK